MSGNLPPGYPPDNSFVQYPPPQPQQAAQHHPYPGQQDPYYQQQPHLQTYPYPPQGFEHAQPGTGGGGYDQSASSTSAFPYIQQQPDLASTSNSYYSTSPPHPSSTPHQVFITQPPQQQHATLAGNHGTHPYAAAYASASVSPQPYTQNLQQPQVASPVQWHQQQHQQLQQQLLLHQQQQQQLHQSLSPATLTPQGPSAVIPPPPAAAAISPSQTNGNASSTSRVPKITLRLPLTSTNANPDMGRSRRNSSRSAATTAPDLLSPTTGRPRRSRASTKVNYADEDDDFEEEPEEEPEEEEEEPATPPPASRPTRGTRGRPPGRASKHVNDDDEDGDYGGGRSAVAPVAEGGRARRSARGRKASEPTEYADADDFENNMLDTSPVMQPVDRSAPRRRGRRFAVDPDEDEAESPVVNEASAVKPDADADAEPPQSQRSRGARHSSADAESFAPSDSNSPSPSSSPDPIADDYIEEDAQSFVDDDSPRRAPPRRTQRSTASAAPRRSTRNSRRVDSEEEVGGRRNLRKRNNVDYTLPPIDLTAELAAAERNAAIMNQAMGARGGRPGRLPGFGAMRKFPWMKTDNLPQAMGDPDSSDSDDNLQMAAGPSRGAAPAGMAGPNVPGPTDVPNFGRFNPKSSTADADPLGVDVNVTFDRVGGLDHHINQLKEMVALPLLYPELFKQFGIIPPRGVLFHGPPGTGKTLLARALAASCSNGNTKISFFMRKGADVLSKWVGEAERQLRMLFEEARASQPSIIFFDEIDGLAPVRSSKQDQIHASLVSTLLALMDGMDGRGQVIVIGATNRPDAVDPALRRPGRFDREFYFPLPSLDARRQIIKINTREWEPQMPDDMLNTLATLTKGYGGADLRALCTESALNAIQRKYPQIYKTADRLQVQPGSIRVQPKDFMLAVKKIIPSSARSTSSAAIQLPPQLMPLLSQDLERIKTAMDRALPPVKKRTALEEAEFEDEDGDSFEKEIMLQSLDKLRTYRPRLLVYGSPGSGQTYLGPALLHHLEGFHVQSFDLATLMSDSARTTEAAIVQLFIEAKRHQPSVIFIPSLSQWSATVSETARATARALLDGIPPSDPVLLLAVVDGPLSSLPADVRSWFGYGTENRIQLSKPDSSQRNQFFAELLASVERKPTDFPDGVPRKRRVLEELPLAEPLPPRQPTQAELARELERDNAARNMITLSFTSLLSEFARKYRRPVALAKQAAFSYAAYVAEQAAADVNPPPPAAAPVITVDPVNDGGPSLMEVSGEAPVAQLAVVPPEAVPNSQVSQGPEFIETFVSTEPSLPPVAPVIPAIAALSRETVEGSAQPSEAPSVPKVDTNDVDIDHMQQKLIKHKYYTPAQFLADIAMIEENAKYLVGTPEQLKVHEMCAHAKSHVLTFDPKWNPEFERYSHRMHERKAERRAKREKEKAEAEAKEREKALANGGGGAEGEGDGANNVNGKRTRQDGDEQLEGAPAEKRARENGMDVDPVESIQNGSTQLTAHDSIQGFPPTQPAEAPKVPTPPRKQPTPPPKTPTPPASKEATPAVAKEPTPPARTPTPPPVYPPFVVPSSLLLQLSSTLKHDTGTLTVEELEQLRATLLDCVWRGRTEWDRTTLIKEMVERAAEFIAEVKEVAEMERHARERDGSVGF